MCAWLRPSLGVGVALQFVPRWVDVNVGQVGVSIALQGELVHDAVVSVSCQRVVFNRKSHCQDREPHDDEGEGKSEHGQRIVPMVALNEKQGPDESCEGESYEAHARKPNINQRGWCEHRGI